MDAQKENLEIVKISNIPTYSEDYFFAARERLLLHKQSQLKFQAKLSSAIGATLPGDYSMGRISHNYFSACTFENASLKRVAGTGSIFRDTNFLKTDLTHATFQSSIFETCSFEGCNLEGCNMSECCSFLGTKPGNLGEAVLENVYLENVRLANMNLEFCEFQKIKTNPLSV